MVWNIVVNVLVKGILALIGLSLLFGGASAMTDGSEGIGFVMGLLGLVLLLGLKSKGN